MKKIAVLSFLLGMVVVLAACETTGGEVNLYTSRHYDADQELYDRFEDETGIKVNIIQAGGDVLLERILSEGSDTQADLFMTVNISLLEEAKEQGILQPFESSTITSQVEEGLYDPEQYWTGLTMRARIFAYALDRVDPSELSTYEALAFPSFADQIVVRTSSNAYNQNMIASFIELYGAAQARQMIEGWVSNFARSPEGNDRDQARAVAAGIGNIAIMNTYYLGLLKHSSDPADVAVADSLGVFFPNQDTTGTHINVSGGGIVAGAKNVENATLLLEFLTSEDGQRELADNNFEYPVNPNVEPHPYLASFGKFKREAVPFAIIGDNIEEAYEIMLEAGWQ